MQTQTRAVWLNRVYRRLLVLMCFAIIFGSIPFAQAVEPRLASAAKSVAAPASPAPYSGFLSAPAAGDALDIALAYLGQQHADYGLTANDIANVVVKDRYVSDDNGVTHLYLRQQSAGIEVYNGDININIMPDGRILNLGSRFVPNLQQAINTTQPTLTAVEAVERAAKSLRLPVTAPLVALNRIGGVAQAVELSNGGISLDSIPVQLVYQPLENGTVRLAWQMVLRLANHTDWLNLQIDAQTGATLETVNWTINEADDAHDGHADAAASLAQPAAPAAELAPSLALAPDSYRVFAEPVETPNHGVRTLESNPADALASPFGWHDTNGAAGAEFTTTRGNNVTAYTDVDDNNLPDPNSAPDGGATLDFDFPLDLTQQPTAYVPASVTNLFYWNNTFHDVMYNHGFDEASGNFQENNYGRGGLANDVVRAEASDGNRLNNANFSSPPDGQQGRMQMFLWDRTSPMRDGSLDNGIIVHEYGHGVSIRLTGGPSNSNCLSNDEQAGEGWSDFYGLIMTVKPSDTGTTLRGIGTYVLGQPVTGTGIRAFPYNTDMSIDPRTYDSIKGTSGPHPVGSVWATMVWDLYWNLVETYGFDPDLIGGTGGNNIAVQLVTDGLKLQPCGPSFTDSRDAILAADLADNDGVNACLIWESFAKRGLGFSADDGSNNNRNDGTQAFDLSPACTLDVTPDLINACAPAPVQYQILAANIGAVTLSVTGQPAGSTATLSPNSLPTTPATATLTIGNLGAAAAGEYTLTVTATGGPQPINTTAQLNLFTAVPTAASLTTPANGATGVLAQPTLIWTASTQGLSYTVELATDAGFTNIVISNTTQLTSYAVPSFLAGSTTYYWRVRAENGCGAAPVSPTSTFTVRATPTILLVDDAQIGAATQSSYVTALDSLGLTYDIWSTSATGTAEPNAAQLAGFKTILWVAGEDGFITQEGEDALAARLNQKACVVVTGQEYYYNRGEVVTPFMAQYLGVASAVSDIGYASVNGAGPIFSTLGSTTLTFPSGYSNWSDRINPDATATTIFTYGASSSAAIAKDASTYGTMFLGFPIEAITSSTVRADTIDRAVDWCSAYNPTYPIFLPLVQR